MIAFIDDHRGAYGVEPICKVLPIAPSTYYAQVARRADPTKRSARARSDAALTIEIRRVFDGNFQVYGVRKVWHQLRREGFDVARCTVARLMKAMDLQGVIRGKSARTTVGDKAASCPLDRVNRDFKAPAPNRLWVSDFTYVSTWAGFIYVAFVIDAYARRIVGWRASRIAQAGFVLDALEQALHARRPFARGGLVHHSDRGSQYLSIKYTERLAEAGIEPRSAASATATTMRSPKPLTGCSRPRSSIDEAPGETWRPWSSPPSHGSTGSTTAVSSSRSAISRRPRRKPPTTFSLRQPRWPRRAQTNLPPANPGRFSDSGD
jgi:putative transposase